MTDLREVVRIWSAELEHPESDTAYEIDTDDLRALLSVARAAIEWAEARTAAMNADPASFREMNKILDRWEGARDALLRTARGDS